MSDQRPQLAAPPGAWWDGGGGGIGLGAEMGRGARQGLEQRLAEIRARHGEGFDPAAYYERLDREIPVIRDMGFAGYMLIVQDYISHARKLGMPVGPSYGLSIFAPLIDCSSG